MDANPPTLFIYFFFLLNLHLYKPDPPSRARIFLQNRENWEHRDILEMFYSHPRAGACCSCPLSPALLALYSGNFLQSSLPMSFFWEWEDNPADRICKIVSLQGLVVIRDSLAFIICPWPAQPLLGLDLGNVWRIFQILPGLGARTEQGFYCSPNFIKINRNFILYCWAAQEKLGRILC